MQQPDPAFEYAGEELHPPDPAVAERLYLLPDPAVQPTMAAAEAAKAVGIGEPLVRRQGQLFIDSHGAEGIPCLRIGRLVRFPTAAIRAYLGVDPPLQPIAPNPPAAPAFPGARALGKASTFKGGTDGGHAPAVRIRPVHQRT